MDELNDDVDSLSLAELGLYAVSKAISNLFYAPGETTKILVQVQNKTAEDEKDTEATEAGTDPVWHLNGQFSAFRTVPRSQWWKANSVGVMTEFIQSITEWTVRTAIDPGMEPEEIVMVDPKTNQPVTLEIIPDEPLDAIAISSTILGGCFAALVSTPFELLYTRLLVQRRIKNKLYYTSVTDAVKKIYNEEGVGGFYAGLWPTMLAHGWSAFMMSLGDDVLEWMLDTTLDEDPLLFGVCDIAWNTLRLAVLFPLDTVRRRLYIQGAVKRGMHTAVPTNAHDREYDGAIDCMSRIIAEEGVCALYQGFAIQSIATACLIAAWSWLSVL